MKTRTIAGTCLLAVALGVLFSACQALEVVTDTTADILVGTGTIREGEGDALRRTGSAVAKSFADITPEQEYYIGRTVAATLLADYPPLENEPLTEYVNLLGQALALASERPETFGGYRFLVLESEEVNAFAAPGGFIMITLGLLRCCPDEDALAAVLAHEIGHVQHKDALRAIRSSRVTTALTTIGTEGTRLLGGEDLRNVLQAFEGSINDITQTLVVNGYSRRQEQQADAAAIRILTRIGYDPRGLIGMLEEMDRRLKPGGFDFAKTHPAPSARIADARKAMGAGVAPAAPAARAERWAAVMATLPPAP